MDSEVYIAFIQAMRNFLANLPNPILMENVRLVHDNARPHVSQATKDNLANINVRLLLQPPYSPDCNLHVCDRHIFPRLEAIRGRDKTRTGAILGSAAATVYQSTNSECPQQNVTRF